ncbi:hypothetical protein P3L10_018675 [Capsicum annuum]
MHEMDINLVIKDSDLKVEVIARYKHLCQTFVQISSETFGSKEGYELPAICVNELITKLNDIKKRKESVKEPTPDNNIQSEANETIFVDNSNVSKVVAEGIFPPWYLSQLSQGSSNGSVSQLLRDVSFNNLNK